MTLSAQLWMGGLEPYMSENFLLRIFQRVGEKPVAIKVMRNRYSGEPSGYAFVHFNTEDEAKLVLHKLNGKLIPTTSPPIRFKLNHASSSKSHVVSSSSSVPSSANTPASAPGEKLMWVGDLMPDVNDYILYKTFASRYHSVKGAKVFADSSGHSKGFGFVKFSSEEELKLCLTQMNNFKGLGGKPIKINTAMLHVIPKSARASATNVDMSGGYYANQDSSSAVIINEPPYWQNYLSWQSEDDQNIHSKLPLESISQMFEQPPPPPPPPLPPSQEDDLELIEYNVKLEVEAINREITQRDYNMWDALECSKWMSVSCSD